MWSTKYRVQIAKPQFYDNLRFCPNCGEKIYIQSFRNDNLGDLYKILQVDPSAEQEVIEAAYKRLAAKYHPDVNKAPDAQTRMQEINKAYGILSKPETRKQYDQTRVTKSNETKKQEPPEVKTQGRATQTQTYSTPRQAPKSKPKPKPYQPVKTLIVIVLILAGVVWCVSLMSVPATTAQPSVLPTRTLRPTPRPTERPTRVHNPTPIRSTSDCKLWNEVINKNVGKLICVYGKVSERKGFFNVDTGDTWFLIRFDNNPKTFYITSEYGFDIEIGDCVRAQEVVQADSNGVLHMKVEDLYKCSPSMIE
jgi:hypothetical protein